MRLGTFIGKERADDEFKEFRFDEKLLKDRLPNKRIDPLKLEFLLWLSHHSIKTWIDKYTCKYLVAYANTDIDKGNLRIGISDYGEVLGIPVPHWLVKEDYKMIRYWIKKASQELLAHRSNHIPLASVMEETQVDIQEVDVSTIDIFDYSVTDYLGKRQEEYELYEKTELDYMKKHRAMIEKLDYYKRSINEIINERPIRDELIQFITDNHFLLKSTDYVSLVERLKTDEVILFDTGEIMRQKQNIATMGYWISEFRDRKTDEILLDKPSRNNLSKPVDPYYLLLRDFRPLIEMFVNRNVKMCVINIVFPGKKRLDPKYPLYYPVKDDFLVLFRSSDSYGNPCCIY